ncbi:MAG: proton glutamate symport protein, DAACS family [Methyloprofundus sp.]|nr:MAG: proton glutamate symport protein, DAACS family [Methyloprofundus sp.]
MKKFANILLNPWIIFFSVITGSVIGVFEPQLANSLAPFGVIYLKLLQMLVLPVLMTAIISGLGRLFISGSAQEYLVKVLLFLVVNLMLISAMGVSVGHLGKVGSGLGEQAQITLGKTISAAEANTDATALMGQETSGVYLFIQAMVPSNIFQALVNGDNLAILFFSILVGISMGLLGSSSSYIALDVVDAFYGAFLAAINWVMYLLPFGLCCLFASQVAQVGLDIFWAMSKLVLFIYLSASVLILGFALLIAYKSKISFLQTLAALRQPFFVALGTASSFASIPAALTALQDKLQVKHDVADLIVPLGMTINPPGSVLYFAIAGTFIAQIYNVSLGLDQLAIMVFAALLAGISSASAPGIVGLSMISMVLIPLGLPVEVAIILLVAIDPIVDPILTVVNVFSNCAMAVIASEPDKTEATPNVLHNLLSVEQNKQ